MTNPLEVLPHVSYSSLNSYNGCPRKWAEDKLMGNKAEPNDKMKWGSEFDDGIGRALGKVKSLGFMEERVEALVKEYLKQDKAWKDCDTYQERVFADPDQWNLKAEKFAARTDMPFPFLGFIDMAKGKIVTDLKTGERKGFQQGWLTQVNLYTSLTDRDNWEIHHVVRRKRESDFYFYEGPLVDAFARASMNWAVYTANNIYNMIKEDRPIEEYAIIPNFFCNDCPLKGSCPGALAKEMQPHSVGICNVGKE